MDARAGAAAANGLGRDRGLAPGWWAPGLALHERGYRCENVTAVPDDRSMARAARWRERYGARADLLTKRLAEVGIDVDLLPRLLAERPSSLAARVSQPWWADAIVRAVDAARPLPDDEQIPADWRDAFARPLQPLILTALRPMADRLAPLADAAGIDLPAVTEDLVTGLGRSLARLAARTLVAELHVWRDAGRLVGSDSQERFVDFVRRLCEPARLGHLFTTYPVLARLLAQTAQFEADAVTEMLTRLASDRRQIVSTMLSDSDPGLLRRMSANCGETHQKGRSVRFLHFADGTTLVYKPRSIEAQVRLAELIEWLNAASPGLGLRTPSTLAMPHYGWMEFITNSSASDRNGITRFYNRLGAQLALLHIMHATDMHCENIIACGDQPIVVDAETIFHPMLSSPARPDPAARALATSVARTGLLPSFQVSADGPSDISAFGGHSQSTSRAAVDWDTPGTDQMRMAYRTSRHTDARNRPLLGGVTVQPEEHQDALLQGFRRGYDAIARNRAQFTELVQRCELVDVRVVVRPTCGYVNLLDEANHPDLLRDALDRDQVLDALWAEVSDGGPQWLTARHEAKDLWDGDTPLFVSRPGSRDVLTSTGVRLGGVLDTTELSRVVETIATLGEPDRQDQEWVIRATIATRHAVPDHHRASGEFRRLTPVAAQPERLLAAACGIADHLIALAATDDERVNWLGLELADDRQWLVMPMGAGLGNGYLGVALFLAQTFKITGVQRYGDVARRAARSYRQVHDVFSGHPNLVTAVGCGGMHGLGGIAYGLARLAVLLEDEQAAVLARETVAHAAVAAETTDVLDWVNGMAGCLAAMKAVHTELGVRPARQLAHYCADRIVAGAAAGTDWIQSCLTSQRTGFAQGVAGVAYSLAQVAADDARHLDAATAATAALSQARSHFPLESQSGSTPGWCAGVAGRLLAEGATANGRLQGPGLEDAVRLLAHRPVLSDLSLCHGELGIIESLIALEARRHAFVADAVRHRAGLILDALQHYGPTCGTPNAAPTPGLLNGLAGIGYGLLRLSLPTAVPSVLLLEPATPGTA